MTETEVQPSSPLTEDGLLTEEALARLGVKHPPLVRADGMPTPYGWRKMGNELRKPIAYKSYTAKGKQYSYITARDVMDRLDAVAGVGNWSTSFRELADGSVECTLTIMGVSKADVGYRNNPDATPDDRQFEFEPMKAAYSDAFKRAAVHFGIGRFLYDIK